MSNGNDDDFENTTKKYFLVVKIFFVFNCNWNWKCLGEKSPKHLFFGKKWNFFRVLEVHFTRFEVTRGLSRVCKNGACGRRASQGFAKTGRVVEEQREASCLVCPKSNRGASCCQGLPLEGSIQFAT